MSRTYNLRAAIMTLLGSLKVPVYYENAIKDTPYPYVVFELESIDYSNNRDDVILTVNVWDKGYDSSVVEDLADSIEDIFNYNNYPTDDVLPTFFKANRMVVLDEDKEIRRRQLQFQVQNYER